MQRLVTCVGLAGRCLAWVYPFDWRSAEQWLWLAALLHGGMPCRLCLLAAQHFVGYDPEGYTMYFCDYKYTDENTVNYVVMNKVRLLPLTAL